jgi:hypothetical protein
VASHLQTDEDPDPAFDFDVDENPDPAYHVYADPDMDESFQFDAYTCGSGSTTLITKWVPTVLKTEYFSLQGSV